MIIRVELDMLLLMVNHSWMHFLCDNPNHLKLSRQPFPFCSLNKQVREYSKILTREKIQLYSNTTWWLEKRLEPALYRQWILFETQILSLKFYKHFLVKRCAQFFFQAFEGRGAFPCILPVLCQSLAQSLGSPDSLIQILCHMPSHPVMLLINESSFIFKLTGFAFSGGGCCVCTVGIQCVS